MSDSSVTEEARTFPTAARSRRRVRGQAVVVAGCVLFVWAVAATSDNDPALVFAAIALAIGSAVARFSRYAWPALLGIAVALCGGLTLRSRTSDLLDLQTGESHRMQCSRNVRMLSLALQSYYQSHNCYPPPYTTDPEGKPLLSWRVQLLPYLDREDLYAKFHHDEPWDSPHNRTLIAQMPVNFRCAPRTDQRGFTSYVAVTGPETMWLPQGELRADGITDGLQDTLAIIEYPLSEIVWTAPEDVPLGELWRLYIGPRNPEERRLRHGAGVNVALADGGTRYWDLANVSLLSIRAYATRAGNERQRFPSLMQE